MVAMNLMPAMSHRMLRDEGLRWKERLENLLPPYIFPWKEHPQYDEFWQSKMIVAERIQVLTFLIGGWGDLFPEGMVRAYERIAAPRKLLMGRGCTRCRMSRLVRR
jgi:predicted acyl esterase